MPVRVRLYLALAIALVLVPTLPPMPVVESLSLASLLLIAEQLLIGVMFGFVLQLFFHVFIVSGQLLAMQMGLGFASMVDPANGISVPVLGQFFNMLVILLFLSVNGHLVVLEILAELRHLPVGRSVDQSLLGSGGQAGLGAGRRVAAGAAGDHRAAGG